MAATRALIVFGGTLLLAGCGTVPSYYTERMAADPGVVTARAAPDIEPEPVRAAPKPRRAKRATPPAAEVATTPETVRPVRSTTENTGAAAPAARNPAIYEPDAARAAQRERAINRSMGSICTGC